VAKTIKFSAHTKSYLDELTKELYYKNYFSFFDSSIEYVDLLIDYIVENVLKNIHKKSPIILAKYGSFYLTYNSTKRTTWYIFFEMDETQVLITHISNNYKKEMSIINC